MRCRSREIGLSEESNSLSTESRNDLFDRIFDSARYRAMDSQCDADRGRSAYRRNRILSRPKAEMICSIVSSTQPGIVLWIRNAMQIEGDRLIGGIEFSLDRKPK